MCTLFCFLVVCVCVYLVRLSDDLVFLLLLLCCVDSTSIINMQNEFNTSTFLFCSALVCVCVSCSFPHPSPPLQTAGA